jgi:tRNA A37 N6-isopentenylltransferase MiaA
VLNEKRAEIKVSDLPPVKTVEVIIGGTAYLVSSFFKKDAKGDAVDKVRRLIERDTENLSEK